MKMDSPEWPMFEQESPRRGIRKFAPLLLPLAIIAFYWLYGYTMSRSRKVYLVNGLTKPYTVNIQGKTVRVEPEKPYEIKIAESSVEVNVEEKELNIPTQVHLIQTSFLSRPFSGKIFVINPDGAAILVKAKVMYIPKDSNVPLKGSAEFYVGSGFYEFSGVHYAFTLPPQTLTTYGKTGDVLQRYYLAVAITDRTMEPRFYFYLIKDAMGKEKVELKAVKHLLYESNKSPYLDYLRLEMQPEAFVELLRPGLQRRPLNVEWHRAYQTSVFKVDPNEDLTGEYQALLAGEPENPDLQYLLGCVLRDFDEVERIWTRGIQSPSPCQYSLFALGKMRLSEGRFEEAVDFLSRSAKLAPERIRFRQASRDALEASGRYEEAIKEYQKEMIGDFQDVVWIYNIVRLEFLREGKDHAERSMEECLTKIKSHFTEEVFENIRKNIQSNIAYYAGDTAAYMAARESNKENEQDAFEWSFSMANPGEAEKQIERFGKKESWHYLLLCLLCVKTERYPEAEQYLKKAVSLLRKEGWEANYAADCFEGVRQPDPAYICRMPFEIEDKVCLLCVLGERFPHQKTQYFSLAKKLNYNRDFPYHFVNYVLGSE